MEINFINERSISTKMQVNFMDDVPFFLKISQLHWYVRVNKDAT